MDGSRGVVLYKIVHYDMGDVSGVKGGKRHGH